MISAGRNLLALRWSLLRCAALLLVAAGMSLVVRQMAVRAASAETRENARHDALRARLSGAANAADAQRRNARYQDMLAHGYIGPERRLDWVERIAQIKEARRLVDVQYELAPQTAADGLPAGGYELKASAMKLQMALLHEDDLLGFLDDLAATVPAILRVRACTVERSTATTAAGGDAPLKADCSIDWITLRERP